MTFAVPALNVLHTLIFVAAEGEEQFDPNKVTSGPAGFIMTAVMAIAVITLGMLLVRRLRRNQYRSEARAVIAEEIAANDAADAGSGSTAEAGTQSPSVDQPEAENKPADKEGGEG